MMPYLKKMVGGHGLDPDADVVPLLLVESCISWWIEPGLWFGDSQVCFCYA